MKRVAKNSAFPFNVRYIDKHRCLCLKNYAVSSQYVIRELHIELSRGQSENLGEGKLRYLDLVFTRDHLNQFLTQAIDAGRETEEDSASCWIDNGVVLWRVYRKMCVMGIHWRLESIYDNRMHFALQKLVMFGTASEETIDLGYHFIDFIIEALNAALECPEDVFSFADNHLTIDPFALFLGDIAIKRGFNKVPKVDGGACSVRFEDGDVNFIYDATCDISSSPAQPVATQDVEILSWRRKDDWDFANALNEALLSDIDDDFDDDEPGEKTQRPTVSHPYELYQDRLSWDSECLELRKKYENNAQGMLGFAQKVPVAAEDEASYGDTQFSPMFSSNHVSLQDSEAVKAERFKHVDELHSVMFNQMPLDVRVAKEALEDVKSNLSMPLYVGLLYIIHTYAPVLDEALKLSALCAETGMHDPLLLNMLCDIYQREHNDTLLLDLYQQMLQVFAGCPHETIRISIAHAQILSERLNLCAAAVKVLDALKATVQTFGNTDEKLAYAHAYHEAKGTSLAIHHLRQFMLDATSVDEAAAYGYALARMMIEHNDPLQAIINVCMHVLDAKPNHLPTFKILVNCMESSERYEDASFYCEKLLLMCEHDLELCRARERLVGGRESREATQVALHDAIEAVQTLERIFSSLDRAPSKCIALKHHMALQPDSLVVLSKLLKQLELVEAFDEMAVICQKFLENNAGKLEPNQELSVCLTLHNIYDQRIHDVEKSDVFLKQAREIAPLDPRVIQAEIDVCRRRGQKSEQVGLRKSLIDVLPPEEAVEQILLLIQVYEDINEDPNVIIEALRRALTLQPESRQVLLELRRYLRKEKRYFELAAVLEKLVPMTKDLTSRKSILFEASEAHQHLGNEKRAEELYHEAQLLTPINPEVKPEFIPPFVHMPSENRKLMDSKRISGDNFNKIEVDSNLVRTKTTSTSSQIHEFQSLSSMIMSSSDSVINAIVDEVSSSEIEHMDWSSDSEDTLMYHDDLNFKLFDDNSDNDEKDDQNSDSSLAERIAKARRRGNTQKLLASLIESQKNLDEEACNPRILQEIGCIYLYDEHDSESARSWLERASRLSEDVAMSEQTLNALEQIYLALRLYVELATVYERKCEKATLDSEKNKCRILLAQLYYEHLGRRLEAIEILEKLRKTRSDSEPVLSLLAQMYMDTQQFDEAIMCLNEITPLLEQNSPLKAQHILKLATIYIERDDLVNAKTLLRDLLDHNEHIDKLAVIELYKRVCRMHDEWTELLDILQDELCYYLNIKREAFTIDMFVDVHKSSIPMGYAIHTLREYADILYQKLGDITQATKLYQTIERFRPDDDYAFKMLCEMALNHPEHEETVSAVLSACSPAMNLTEEQANCSSLTPFTFRKVRDSGKIFEQIVDIHRLFKSGMQGMARQQLDELEEKIDPEAVVDEVPQIIQIVRAHWESLSEKS